MIRIDVHDRPTAAVLAIRRAVFVEEQGISDAEEFDGTDDRYRHWLLHDGDTALATLRTRMEDGTLAIGRVATMGPARGRGLARRLMDTAIADGTEAGARRAYLSAQEAVIPWYETLGFTAHGAAYDDAGIPHRDMWRDL